MTAKFFIAVLTLLFFIATTTHMVLLVVLSFTAVPRLRARRETARGLGLDYRPWCGLAFNICTALMFPVRTMRAIRGGNAAGLLADADMLYKHLTPRELKMGRACYRSMLIGGMSLCAVGAIQRFGTACGIAMLGGLACAAILLLAPATSCLSAWGHGPHGLLGRQPAPHEPRRRG